MPKAYSCAKTNPFGPQTFISALFNHLIMFPLTTSFSLITFLKPYFWGSAIVSIKPPYTTLTSSWLTRYPKTIFKSSQKILYAKENYSLDVR